MAIKRYSGDRWSGLSGDTKPSGVLSGAIFVETDTGDSFVFNGTAWVAAGGSIPDSFGIVDADGTLLESDSTSDTLTINAGANVTITADAGTDTLTIAATNTTYTPGALLDLAGTTFNVDLTELNDITAALVGTDELVVLDGSSQGRKALNEIGLSLFDNDSGFLATVNIAQGTRTGTTVPVTNSGGTNATLQAATTSLAGVMSSSDKTKLDGIATGAEVNAVDSVNGETGVVVLDTDDISEGAGNLYFTDERVDDRVNALLVGGTNVTLTYNDAGNSLTIDATDTTYTAGALLDLTGTTFAVDLSELTDMTVGMAGSDEFVVLDAGLQRRKAASEIGLAIFNNDAGFITGVDLGDTYTATQVTITNDQGTNAVIDSATGSLAGAMPAADKTKIDYISVTQAVDLDAIETRVNELDASVILMGTFDASGGSFPGSGSAQAGESWIVSTGGTIDGVEFTANDRIVAITDNASTTTYAANWHKLDYTDAVLSVAGKTGAVTLAIADVTSLQTELDSKAEVAGSTSQIQYNNVGDLAASANFLWDNTNQNFEVAGGRTLTEGGTLVAPATHGEVYEYVETEVVSTDTITRYMVRLGNGDDVIVASYIQAT